MLLQELKEASVPQQKEALAHFRMGEERFKNWQYRDAVESYQASYEVFGSLSALLARGVALMMVSELKDAAEVFEEGRNLSRARKDARLEAAFGINLGQVCNDLGEPDRSQKALKGARDLCRESEDAVLEAMALRHLGMIFLAQALYDEALACCEEAIQISEEIKDKISVGHILCNKAVILVSKGNLNDAEKVFQQGLMLGQELEAPYIQGRIYTNLASLHLIRGRVQETTSALERALDVHRSIDYRQGEARNLGVLAVIQIAEGNPDMGHRIFKSAVEIDRQLEYRRGEIRELFTMARAQLRDGPDDKTLQLFQAVSDLAKKTNHRHLQVETSVILASLMPDISTEKRISILKDNMELSRSINSPVLQIRISNALGGLYTVLGLFDKAIDCFQKAVNDSRKIGNLIEEAKSLVSLSHIHDQMGKTELAAENMSIAQALFQSQTIHFAIMK
ncbi:MAG: tetratricopeptide repeat protein [Ekhidna sp.]|nr:tetratricopeptide repeat protein [Ekhidna sp.]